MLVIAHNLLSLSILYGLSSEKLIYNESPKNFLAFCKKKIKNCENLQRKEISKNTIFLDTEITQIKHGLLFAQFLKEKFLYKNNELNNIEALSLNILNNIENIKINDDLFSIKDKNINIENIELSRLFNYIFQENMFNEKSNIFEKIDKKSLEILFLEMKDIAIKQLSINSYEKSHPSITKMSYSISTDKLYFFFKGYEFYLENFSDISYDNFYLKMPSTYLQIFSNYVNENILTLDSYKKKKEIFLNSLNLKITDAIVKLKTYDKFFNSIFILFRIIDKSYYILSNYENIECYRVPNKEEFKTKFSIKEVLCKVENTHLNIKITIENNEDLSIITIDNIVNFDYEFGALPKIKTLTDEKIFTKIYELI